MTLTALAVFVAGNVRPEGALKLANHGRLVHQRSRELDTWRTSVAVECQQHARAIGATRDEPLFGRHVPVRVSLVFRMTAPKRRTRPFPSVKPDGDKLERAVLDGITMAGNVWIDDGQAVEVCWRKRYAGGAADPPGCAIAVELVDT